MNNDHWSMLRGGLYLEKHNSLFHCAFLQSWSRRSCHIYLTLDVFLIQDSYTPLYFASQQGHEEMVKLLLDHKADINKVHVQYSVIESVDSISKDGPDTPRYTKGEITQSICKVFNFHIIICKIPFY